MKKFLPLAFLSVVLFAACGKNNEPPAIVNTCQAKVDGQLKTFTVSGSSFGRIGDTKIFSLTAVSADNTISFSFTVKDTSVANALSLKSYVVRYANQDDPNTTIDESLDSDEAMFEWLSDAYMQNGSIAISSFDETKNFLSGSFELQATPTSSGSSVNITEGAFSTQFSK
jgi:hypothetical protein